MAWAPAKAGAALIASGFNPSSSRPVPSRPAPSRPAPSRPAPSHPAPSHPAPSHPAMTPPTFACARDGCSRDCLVYRHGRNDDRGPRLGFPSARHQVMNRCARHATVLVDDEIRARFLDLLGELPERLHVRVHGYALMPSRYHLMPESVSDHLQRVMSPISVDDTRRLNRRLGRDGPPFRGRCHDRDR